MFLKIMGWPLLGRGSTEKDMGRVWKMSFIGNFLNGCSLAKRSASNRLANTKASLRIHFKTALSTAKHTSEYTSI